MKRKTTSIKIDPEVWKQVKKACIDEETDISTYVENLLKSDLENKKRKL